jgi:hypothetical protein
MRKAIATTPKKAKKKAKTPKVYTLAEVAEFLGFSGRSIRDFVKVGLIHAFPNPTWMVVTEDELQRVIREGIDTSYVTARVIDMRRAAAKTAKKRAKRRSAGSTVAKKKLAKHSTATATKKGTKKQVKRGVTATRKITKRRMS